MDSVQKELTDSILYTLECCPDPLPAKTLANSLADVLDISPVELKCGIKTAIANLVKTGQISRVGGKYIATKDKNNDTHKGSSAESKEEKNIEEPNSTQKKYDEKKREERKNRKAEDKKAVHKKCDEKKSRRKKSEGANREDRDSDSSDDECSDAESPDDTQFVQEVINALRERGRRARTQRRRYLDPKPEMKSVSAQANLPAKHPSKPPEPEQQPKVKKVEDEEAMANDATNEETENPQKKKFFFPLW